MERSSWYGRPRRLGEGGGHAAPSPRRRRFLLLAAGLAGLVSVGGCSVLDRGGGAGGAQTLPVPPRAADDQATVVLANVSYNPTPLSVPVGETITWRWEDNGLAHTVTADDGSFDSGRRTSGEYVQSFRTPGEYRYHCEIHARMKGTIVVTGS